MKTPGWRPVRAPALAAMGLALALGACGDEQATLLQPVASGAGLATVTVTRAQLSREILHEGRVEALKTATISAQTAARVVELPVDVGDRVEQGQVVARLRGVNAQAGIDAAAAAAAEAHARLAEVQLRYARTRDVWERKLIAKAQYDQAEAELKSAQSRVAAAAAAQRQAQEGLDYTVVRAPYSGIVLRREVALGELASAGQPLLTGVSLSQLRVAADLTPEAVVALRRAGGATVVLADGTRIVASGMRIAPAADAATQTLRVLLELPEDAAGGPIPGTLVKIAVAAERYEALQLPASALLRRGEIIGVYVVNGDGGVRLRTLRVGAPDGAGRVPVLAGLAEGEQVATDVVAAGLAANGRTGAGA